MIVVSGVIHLAPETRQQAVQLALDMAKATRKEAGCLTYAFYADLEDENVVRVFEEWEDDEALARHFQTPHMAEFRQALGRVGIVSSTVKRYEIGAVGELG